MQFVFRRVDSLPPLAWCARLERGSPTVTLTLGPWVETGEWFFVEGVWDGPYTEARFDQTCLLMGSGGKIVGQKVVFSTPCHTLERLYLVRCGTSLLVSNSLPFLLAAAGLRLDPNYPNYKVALGSIVHGLDRCAKRIPTRDGPAVRLCYFRNLEVGADLQIIEHAKVTPPNWKNFGEYRRFLADGLAALWGNAGASERRVRYDLLTSISSGYDSPATAALVAEIGCRKAVTFRTGIRYLHGGDEVEDSGAAIAHRLGLEVQEFSRNDYRAADSLTPAEFAACGDAFDLQMGAFERELPQKIFFTGFYGGIIWDRYAKNPGPQIVRNDPSGSSLGEFRRRVGFLHVPLPFFGAVRRPTIHAISNSPEMLPWTLGNDYDRPIPRRIVEDKEVPRELFGQSKKGSFAVLEKGRELSCRLTSFEEFYRRQEGGRAILAREWAEARYILAKVGLKWTRAADRFGLPHVLPSVTRWDIATPGRPSLLVQWGNAVLQERYRVGCAEL